MFIFIIFGYISCWTRRKKRRERREWNVSDGGDKGTKEKGGKKTGLEDD